MTETGTKRRRWPWAVLATALVIVGGPIAYRFRPLNAAERALVGRWTDNGGEFATIFQLNPDRTMVEDETVASWSASGTALYLYTPLEATEGMHWRARVSHYLSNFLSPRTEIRWDGPDCFYVKGETRGEIRYIRDTAESPVNDH